MQLSAELVFLYFPGVHASHRPSSRVEAPVAERAEAELYPYPGGQEALVILMHGHGSQRVSPLSNPYPGRHHES